VLWLTSAFWLFGTHGVSLWNIRPAVCMLNEEPAQSQDLQMMGMLLPLGIEKGKAFKPDVATVA